ncbi:MAG: T9SS type A sorting domain-containing protein [Bacteroidia bacterium]
MKKNLLNLFTLLAFSALCFSASAQNKRFVDEVFSNVLKTTNIEYDSNRAINIFPPNTPPIITVKLRCDIYQPEGDTLMRRPLIILASTGSYLPAIINQQPTGNKDDSSIVELANRLTKRGYVVMAVNYRLGWNPSTTIQAQATEQLIKATYRAIQDVRNAIRYMRVNAEMYKIDTSKIIVGGQGTGGYVALGLAAVDKRSEIEGRVKFQRGDFTPMVSVDTLGDWNGIGGAPFFNYGGESTVSGNAHMVFNYGGAMGDSTWMDASTLPIVGMHCPTDYFAPYKSGNVIVPTTGVTVINSASGAGAVIPYANSLGINNKINAFDFKDPISMRAMSITGGIKNLFPFISSFPAEGSPWEWWDRPTVQANNTYGLGTGRNADSLAMKTNPFMSAARAKAYIDTIAQFICPRIAVQFGLFGGTSVNEVNVSSFLGLFPNPAKENVTISMDKTQANISEINLFDITGKVLVSNSNIAAHEFVLNTENLTKGIYLVNVKLANGASATKRLAIQ